MQGRQGKILKKVGCKNVLRWNLSVIDFQIFGTDWIYQSPSLGRIIFQMIWFPNSIYYPAEQRRGNLEPHHDVLISCGWTAVENMSYPSILPDCKKSKNEPENKLQKIKNKGSVYQNQVGSYLDNENFIISKMQMYRQSCEVACLSFTESINSTIKVWQF